MAVLEQYVEDGVVQECRVDGKRGDGSVISCSRSGLCVDEVGASSLCFAGWLIDGRRMSGRAGRSSGSGLGA